MDTIQRQNFYSTNTAKGSLHVVSLFREDDSNIERTFKSVWVQVISKIRKSVVFCCRMSEFLKRKLRTYFNLKDFDKDGIQTKDNWEQLAITFAEHENADKERAKDIRTRFLNVRYSDLFYFTCFRQREKR